MEGQKFHTVQRVQVPKKRIQNAATCMGRGILMVSQPNLIQINTSVDTIAATTQACCPNRLQVLMIKITRFNNNIYIFKLGFHYNRSISIKVVKSGLPQPISTYACTDSHTPSIQSNKMADDVYHLYLTAVPFHLT